MSRIPRTLSTSGYYHVILRGLARLALFEEEWDYLFFLARLEKYSGELGVGICAYCLMENHVHLLIHDPDGNLSNLIKKLGVSYAEYFNGKYDRIGHLFHDRFKSEPVEDESYFITVFRYILRNPEKAGICKTSTYRWSSYSEFSRNSFLDLDMIRYFFINERQYAIFMAEEDHIECMEYDHSYENDRDREIIKAVVGSDKATDIQKFDKEDRDKVIKTLKNNGMSIRKIERLTGIGRGIIQRINRM